MIRRIASTSRSGEAGIARVPKFGEGAFRRADLSPRLGVASESGEGRFSGPAYAAALQAVQEGLYQPERDAMAFVRLCAGAHIAQARRRLRQLAEAAARWAFLEELVEGRGWPDRLVIALEESLFAGTDRASYAAEAEVSAPTASNDLRRLLDAGLISQRGRGRATRYVASERLAGDVRQRISESLRAST